MMNFFNLKGYKDTFNLYPKSKKKSLKLYPSSVREWNNSIYNFNKNNSYLIPISTSLALRIINTYFTLFNMFVESKLRTKKLLYRFRRLSSSRIYISNGKFKHTNNKVTIVIYLFNRQKNNYFLTIKGWYLKNFYNKEFKVKLIKRLTSINVRGSKIIESINKERFLIINSLGKNSLEIKGFTSFHNYINKFYVKLLKKSLRKLQLYIYYKQLIYLNRSKYNYTFLQYLTKHLERLYNKNVEFNLVNINRFYLDSDIISNSIKLKIMRNRRKLLKYINVLKNKINIKKINISPHKFTLGKPDLSKKLYLKKYTFNKLKYKHISGLRLETKGRLTRRNTASRSLSKVLYKGNLLNMDSSYKGLSSILLKGNLKSNIQLTKLNSKSRIGSFGIKTWISGN